MGEKKADGFVWYELMTKDLDKAIDFYSKVVGWEVKDSGMPGIRYMLVGKNGRDVGGMMQMGAECEGAEPGWMLHIHTADLDAELKALEADGGTVLRPATPIPGVGRFAVVQDPQKVTFMLFEPGAQYMPERLGQMAVGNVTWHELITTDSNKAWDFYSKHFGWEKDYAHDMGPMGVYQTFRADKPMYTGGMMKLVKNDAMPMNTKPTWRFYIAVDDIHAAEKRVKEAGGTVITPPHAVPGGSTIMHATDSQGVWVGLIENIG